MSGDKPALILYALTNLLNDVDSSKIVLGEDLFGLIHKGTGEPSRVAGACQRADLSANMRKALTGQSKEESPVGSMSSAMEGHGGLNSGVWCFGVKLTSHLRLRRFRDLSSVLEDDKFVISPILLPEESRIRKRVFCRRNL